MGDKNVEEPCKGDTHKETAGQSLITAEAA